MKNFAKLLSILLIPTLLLPLDIQPVNAETKLFGRDGRDGNNGRNGRNGMSGEDIVIKANNNPQTFDISGRNGESGEDADSGENAYQCRQPRKVKYNLRGANGGNGGRGGRGRNGGNGGDAVIYFQDIQQLKNIIINNNGGRGGKGGKGAKGGRGCEYRKRSWYINYCTWTLMAKDKKVPKAKWRAVKRKNFRCSGDTFFDEQNNRPRPPRDDSRYWYGWKYRGLYRRYRFVARNGRDGRNGRNGRHGQDGSYGQIALIQGDSIPKKKVNFIGKLSSINGQTIQLLKNNWLRKKGLTQLLAADSNSPNNYTILQTVRNSFIFQWETKKSYLQLGDPEINVSIDKTGNLDFSIPGTLEYKKDIRQEKTTITVINGIEPERLRKFTFRGFDKFKDAYNFGLLDAGKLLPELKGVIINIRVSDGQESQKVTYRLNSQTENSDTVKIWDNIYKFKLGNEFDSLLQPGKEILYNIKIDQITKSGGVYSSGMTIKHIVNRANPNPDVRYYKN